MTLEIHQINQVNQKENEDYELKKKDLWRIKNRLKPHELSYPAELKKLLQAFSLNKILKTVV